MTLLARWSRPAERQRWMAKRWPTKAANAAPRVSQRLGRPFSVNVYVPPAGSIARGLVYQVVGRR